MQLDIKLTIASSSTAFLTCSAYAVDRYEKLLGVHTFVTVKSIVFETSICADVGDRLLNS
jgi:hypothetical protein